MNNVATLQESDSENVDDNDDENAETVSPNTPRYPTRDRPQTNFYSPGSAMLATTNYTELNNVTEALDSEHADQWRTAIMEELESLSQHNTWIILPRQEASNLIPTRFVFRIKLNEDGSISRFKARLVVKGYLQQPGAGLYSPVVDFTAVRVALTVAVQKGLFLRHLDVKTAFLHGRIDDDIFISEPEDLHMVQQKLCESNECLKLSKVLYGLRQSPKLWNMKWNEVMEKLGYNPLRSDPCIFYRDGVWLILCVDDVIMISFSKVSMDKTVKQLKQYLDIQDLGPLQHFLGISFRRDSNGAWLSQSHYIKALLKRFGMEHCKAVSTPICAGYQDITNSVPADKKTFREMIGALLFLSTRTRPDISAAVGLLSRFMSNPMEDHHRAIKRLFRYLKGTIDFGMRITCAETKLVAFADADWGGDRDDRKSTSGNVIQIGGNTVSWKTSKQKLVSLSTAEAEFISASDVSKDIIWIRHLLCEINCEQKKSTVFFEDKQTAIRWANEGVRNAKHFAIRRHFVDEAVKAGIISIQYCSSENMLADVMTKPLLRVSFQRHRDGLGVKEMICRTE